MAAGHSTPALWGPIFSLACLKVAYQEERVLKGLKRGAGGGGTNGASYLLGHKQRHVDKCRLPPTQQEVVLLQREKEFYIQSPP